MKKEGISFILIVVIICLIFSISISVPLVSAGWFADFSDWLKGIFEMWFIVQTKRLFF